MLDQPSSDEGFYRSRHQIQPRRMKQLQAQLVNRHGFRNYTKIYGYGCYCLNLGERVCFLILDQLENDISVSAHDRDGSRSRTNRRDRSRLSEIYSVRKMLKA